MVKRKKTSKKKRKKGRKRVSVERITPEPDVNDIFIIKCGSDHRFVKASSKYIIQSFLERDKDLHNCKFVGQMRQIKKDNKKLYNKLKEEWGR